MTVTTAPAATAATERVASTTTVPGTLTAVQQAAVYETALRHVYVRTIPSLPADQRGILLVDHGVDGAGDRPLSFDETAVGERFSAELLDELSRQLADVPFLGFVASTRDVIGPERPGLLTVVSPIELTPDGATVGVEVSVYPGAGQGWVIVVRLSGADATVVDSQSPWVS